MDVEEAVTPKAADADAAADGASRNANGGTPSKDEDGKEKVTTIASASLHSDCIRALFKTLQSALFPHR